MIATDIFRPGEWHDFFVATAGASAALAGLIFVAVSIHLNVVVHNVSHRARAINMLAGFTAVFVISTLALMGGQGHQAVGTEWLVVATAGLSIFVHVYLQAIKRGGSNAELRPDRLVLATTCFTAQIVGGVVLILGYVAGLYVAAVGLIISFALLMHGAWLLLVAFE